MYGLKNSFSPAFTYTITVKYIFFRNVLFRSGRYFRAGAMSLNQVVPNVANLKTGWFHSIKSQKSSGSIAPFSKIQWFHGTTGTTTNAGPVQNSRLRQTIKFRLWTQCFLKDGEIHMYVWDLEFYKNNKNANKELFEIDYATSTMWACFF